MRNSTLQRTIAAERCRARSTHGKSKAAEYRIWRGMKKRCHLRTDKQFPEYGGRGIIVCDRWRLSFANFYADVGPRPSPDHSIDRYPNNDGNYEPGNVRWATQESQMRNTRVNHWMEHGGKRMVFEDWAKHLGISNSVLWRRLKRLPEADVLGGARLPFGPSIKTACKRGHSLTDDNVYVRSSGRTCLRCIREADRKRRAKA